MGNGWWIVGGLGLYFLWLIQRTLARIADTIDMRLGEIRDQAALIQAQQGALMNRRRIPPVWPKDHSGSDTSLTG